ncbi:MAG: GDSL-type esterase/lipase family protein [Anaerovoracaceae bacterium]
MRSKQRRRTRLRPTPLFIVLCILVVILIATGVTIFALGGNDSSTPAKGDKENTQQQAKPKPYDFSEPLKATKAVDNSYFDDAIFIGNSRTEGLFLYSGLSNAKCYAHKGLMVNTYFTEKTYNLNGTKVSMAEAIKANKSFKKAYIMLGMNELGWGYPKLYIEKYTKILKSIRKINPDVKIYVQSIIPVTKTKSQGDDIYNMKHINKFNKLLQQMAYKEKVYYVNVGEGVSNKAGYLPEDAAFDGVHLKAEYANKWLDYLKTHTMEAVEK